MGYANIIEGSTFNTTLSINNGDTWVRGCIFENIGSNGNGIRVRGCNHVKISDCVFRNIQGYGILLSSLGGTNDVIIEKCIIHDTLLSGIHATQKEDLLGNISLTHSNLIIKDNIVFRSNYDEHHHNIYVQSRGAIITGNTCFGSLGNNISVRSGCTVSNNTCFDAVKSCIRYFPDHTSTPEHNTVIIENNTVRNGYDNNNKSPLISLLDAYDKPDVYLAETYIIRYNTAWSYTSDRYCI